MSKPMEISKGLFVEAFQKVKANKGAAGVDGITIEDFETHLDDNLYMLWNRMSSGSYFPEPVRVVEIPKKGGKGVRTLGIPTIADRVAQTVAVLYMEPDVEPIFHNDSYGYRPGRSALDAVGKCRERCWKKAWVIDCDITSFFDTIDHRYLLASVKRHTDTRWVLLYIERWLQSPLQREDGTLVERKSGTPQGSAISPLLANIFMHHVFDLWITKAYPTVQFERYCDDMVVHCESEKQAIEVKDAISERLLRCHLELHPEKTRIVYCKTDNRQRPYGTIQFDFLGYTFQPRQAKNQKGKLFMSFLPAVSNGALKEMGQRVRTWALHHRSDANLCDLARWYNPVVQGWIHYYGRFYPSHMWKLYKQIDRFIIRWARRKFKRLRYRVRRAWKWLATVKRQNPSLFAYWRATSRIAG